MNMAILGAGNIARQMAKTIRSMNNVTAYAVASRDAGRAAAFAREFGFAKACGSYEEMLADPNVELVYVATPHSLHAEHIRLCLEHGKHVLCEKAFTVNAAQAEEVLSLAKAKGLLLAEAIWTRYMPMRRMLNEIIASGIIGTPHSLTANLCYIIDHVPRLQKPELAGGALLDIGVYTLNFACMVFESEIKEVVSHAVFNDQGVDNQNSIILTFADGKTATLHSNQMVASERSGMIYGSNGYIEVENINNPAAIRVYNPQYELIREIQAPAQITGYEYEVEACAKAIREGQTECPDMPHAEILRMMRLMDAIRADWGMRYPME